jgi:DNA invertase Pin-like site-specific DNA recombinase
MTPDKIQAARAMAADPTIPVSQICKTLGISRDTYSRYVRSPSAADRALV